MALTGVMLVYMPKGFFPIQDIGLINGISEAAQDISPEEMMRLQRELGDVLLRDPTIGGFGSLVGSTTGAKTANTGAFFIVLKPREERELDASQIIDRLRPQLAKVVGANLYLQPAQDITVGGRIARAAFQYTLQDANIAELIEWSDKLLDKMRTLPELVDVGSDLLSSAPQLKVTINRDAGLAIRNFRSDDRRYPQRRLWAAPDHAVFHPAQHLLGDPGNSCQSCRRPSNRSIASTSNRR